MSEHLTLVMGHPFSICIYPYDAATVEDREVVEVFDMEAKNERS
jgi:hypothetical protein